MKLRMRSTAWITLLASMSLCATTLKLAPAIDLLVLDGHKISGSLLKGAEGIELEKGQHQFLFRIEKYLPDNRQNKRYISRPLIATFTASTHAVTIQLPPLNSPGDMQHMDRQVNFQLVDEQNLVVETRRDRLTLLAGDNVEQAMNTYNRSNRIASVPRFADSSNRTAGQHTTIAPEITLNTLPDPLQRWYQQVDAATRKQLQRLMKALCTS